MTDRELLALLRALSRIGGPLANALGPQFGQGLGAVGGGLGLAGGIAGGNVPQAIGGAAQLGSQVANLAGLSNVSAGLGSVAGPLGLASSLASGNWGGAISALPSTISGLTSLGGQLGLLAPQLVNAITAPLSAIALPLTATLTGALSADNEGTDMFDSLFGGAKTKAMKQIEEYQDYVSRFPQLVTDRAVGASLLDHLGSLNPNDLANALALANKGVRATDLSPAYSHIAQKPDTNPHVNSAKLPQTDMTWWEKIAPKLEGDNWAAFLGLLDKATKAGVDVNTIAGDRNRQMASGQGHVFVDASGNNVDADPNQQYSQSAYDISNAIAGVGGQLGVKWGERGDERAGENQGYTLYDDQLKLYGFAPGNQAAATLKYLSKLDPNVTQHANWQMYKDKLGVTDDMLNAIPDYTIDPRDKPMTVLQATAFQAPDGGG